MNILKWMLALLLTANLVFFAYVQWGGALTGDDTLAQSQPLLNAEKIRLLNLAASAIDAAPSVGQSAAACMEWGEFSGNDLVRATKALGELNAGDSIGRHQVEHAVGYWVYMPPQNSRAEVDRKVLQLKALGVTDYFIVQDSKQWQNAISLGIFKTAEAAQKFLESMRAKGVRSAVMGERDGKLKFTVFELNNLDPALIEKILALQNQFGESELKVVPCTAAGAN